MAHFLKRLELNGFKSFAQKTVLEFPSGITAIVGPNGSGKSNVVDAIRWLLGEREAKSLRGAKVEDLIFAGTPKRARLGQAQASLHFENGNKFFPIDAAEVVVSRQVSRDGASSYFLNKSEILLRDLIDFFAAARLGSRGLIVITQGNSDIFIRSNPSDRREMVEEILGLREYQIKKADAERRLKNSQVNLDKAQALIEEILPHLRSLKRQTSRWEKRGVLEEELKSLENHFFGTQFGSIREEMRTVQVKIDGQQDELRELDKEKLAALQHQEKIEASHPEERKRVGKIRDEIRLLLENRSKIEKEVNRIEVQLELAGKTSKKAEQSAERMLQLLEEVRDRLEMALEHEIDDMREAIDAIIKDVNTFFESDSDEAPEEPDLSEAQAQCKAMNKDLERVKNELVALRDEEKKLEAHQEEFYAEFKQAVARVETARKKIEAWERRHNEYVFEKQRLELRKEELVRQMAQAGRDPKDFEGALPFPHAAGHDFSEVERRIFKLRGDLASIGEIDEALVKEATETETRYEFLKKESEDLGKAVVDLKELTRDLNEKIKSEFEVAIVKINAEFTRFFELMFGGGHAKLRVIKPVPRPPVAEGEEAPAEGIAEAESAAQEGGIEIDFKLPRKKVSSLDALSGGERSLVGIAALFALISVSPPPFLVLDEVDAALDERNSKRFSEMLKEFSKTTQFIVVTHNRTTMEVANILYGVTLNEDGTSKILSMKFEGDPTATS
ncbi:MAG: hypothetical protein A3B25_03875 [Candidatus Ryanbacteria bacterium RIFCSPLOWO2_01_FULL_48_26]|uniref:AAA+ ATPase domain-containing protein n=1 Tax=Candidatus Ryanbacteria bacterium RIFCSPLOWO2_01_FULL_48_26 TaxID=1802126 RepID=A0A1G2GT20_9BACT|nr:MAG: hypothetical protein A3B25_03875 [Candidatus Ryanbacteria bacterium RIFCSPLOWO2_01_FULL_48_26]